MSSLCVKDKKPKTFLLRLFSTSGQSLKFSAVMSGSSSSWSYWSTWIWNIKIVQVNFEKQCAGSCLFILVRILISIHLWVLAVVDVVIRAGAVLAVVHLTWQTVHRHAGLGRRFIGAHLQRDGRGVAHLHVQLLIEDLALGAGGRHAGLRRRKRERNKQHLG